MIRITLVSKQRWLRQAVALIKRPDLSLTSCGWGSSKILIKTLPFGLNDRYQNPRRIISKHSRKSQREAAVVLVGAIGSHLWSFRASTKAQRGRGALIFFLTVKKVTSQCGHSHPHVTPCQPHLLAALTLPVWGAKRSRTGVNGKGWIGRAQRPPLPSEQSVSQSNRDREREILHCGLKPWLLLFWSCCSFQATKISGRRRQAIENDPIRATKAFWPLFLLWFLCHSLLGLNLTPSP